MNDAPDLTRPFKATHRTDDGDLVTLIPRDRTLHFNATLMEYADGSRRWWHVSKLTPVESDIEVAEQDASTYGGGGISTIAGGPRNVRIAHVPVSLLDRDATVCVIVDPALSTPEKPVPVKCKKEA